MFSSEWNTEVAYFIGFEGFEFLHEVSEVVSASCGEIHRLLTSPVCRPEWCQPLVPVHNLHLRSSDHKRWTGFHLRSFDHKWTGFGGLPAESQ